MIQAGHILEFLNKNQIMVGVCTQVNANHLRILTEQNKEMNLVEKKVLHVLEQRLPLNANRLEKIDWLKSWSARFIGSATEKPDLQTLWEVLEGESSTLSVAELAEMYFGDCGDLERSLLLRALVEDRIYFDRKGDEGFVPRSLGNVSQIREQLARAAEKEQAREALNSWIHAVLNQDQPLPPPAAVRSFLTSLQDVAVRQQNATPYPQVAQWLQAAGVTGKPEERCLQLLIRSGIWDEDINLHLLEYDVPRHFSEELLQQVQAIQLLPAHYQAGREDLRSHPTITIDDPDTTDIDDALSWKLLDNGHTLLWIHIADPAEFVQPDTPLDQEAAKRFTSIYLCEQKIEMLPAHLAQNISSLVQGQPRLAISVGVELDADGQLVETRLCESIIHVHQRLSYDEVDAQLNSHPELQHLYALVLKLRQQRLDRGAVEFVRPELRIKVTPDKQILLKRVARDSPAQSLVSELMILANYIVARMLGKAQVPLIYKIQEAPSETLADGRPLLKRAEMSTRMGMHYGLGLDAYTQFTSPIRRYNDLILHRQIKSWLRTGQGIYSEAEIQHVIALSDQALFSANFIQRENYRYWLLKYFHQLPTPRHVTAHVRSLGDDKAWVTLEDYCYDVPLPLSDLKDLALGDALTVSLEQIQPRRSKLFVKRVKETALAAPL